MANRESLEWRVLLNVFEDLADEFQIDDVRGAAKLPASALPEAYVNRQDSLKRRAQVSGAVGRTLIDFPSAGD